MRKLFLTAIAFAMASFMYILLTAQESPENSKFYYAFSEKIFLTEVPNKFLIKANSAADVEFLASTLRDGNGKLAKDIIRQKGNCLIVETENANLFNATIKNSGSRIHFTKPCYKTGKAELYYADEIIVETLPGKKISDIVSKLSLTNKVEIVSKKFYSVVKVSPTIDALEIANQIQETGLVSYSHPDFFMNTETHQVIPNDTYFNNQYYLRNTGQVFNPVENHAGTPNADLNAAFAWNTTLGNNAVVVAVIDQGVTGNHPDLPNARQVRLNGSNFAPGQNANDPTPDGNNNHGNACAGIIAATQGNNEGISGIAPNVRIMPIKVAFGGGGTSMEGFAAAIDFAWGNGASVISNSWGTGSDNPNFSPAIVAAINRAVTQGRGGLGCVVTFSASNSATHNWGANGQVRFPSNVQINGVLTVGASDRFDMQADYSPTSNAGSPNNQIIDVVAPSHRAYPPEAYFPEVGGIPGEGFEIWSIDIPGNAGYNQWNDANFPIVAPAFGEVMPNFGANNLSYTSRMGGTSAACPEVAGVAALLLSVNNNLTQQQVFNIITQTAERVGGYFYDANGWSTELGFGRVNACAALTRATPNNFSISGNEPVCSSSTFTVLNLPANATIASWQSSNPSIATVSTNGVVTFVSTGTITLTANLTFANRCGTLPLTKQIHIGGYSSSDYSITGNGGSVYWCPGKTYAFAISGGGGGSNYQWTYPSGWTPNYISGYLCVLNAPTTTYPPTGSVTCTFIEPCGATITKSAFVAYSSSACNTTNPCFIVSPNPAPYYVNINVASSCIGSTFIRKVELLLASTGQQYYYQDYSYGNVTSTSISMYYGYPSGNYYLRVYDGSSWSSYNILH